MAFISSSSRVVMRRNVCGRARCFQTAIPFLIISIFIPKDNLLLYAPVIDNVVELKGFLYEDEVPDSVFKKGRITYSLEKSIFYVNQFIFHDSKAALTWLINNNRSFLRDLFLEYGYDKSDVINKMMIDEVKEEGELPIGKDYKELFVQKVRMGGFSFIKGCCNIC